MSAFITVKKIDNMTAVINLLTAFSAAAAGAFLLAASNLSTALSENQVLFCVCFAGGIGGGIISVGLFFQLEARQSVSRVAFKWVASSLTAALFSPAISQYLQIDDNITYVLALSASVGLTSWSILLVLLPLFGKRGIIFFFLKKLFNIDYNEIIEEPKKDEQHPDWIDVRKSKKDNNNV